jgi:hypothetical protein
MQSRTATKLHAELYGRGTREVIFNLTLQLTHDARDDGVTIDIDTGTPSGCSFNTLGELMQCRDLESEESHERTYRRGFCARLLSGV